MTQEGPDSNRSDVLPFNYGRLNTFLAIIFLIILVLLLWHKSKCSRAESQNSSHGSNPSVLVMPKDTTGFLDWPTPLVGESEYFLMISSVMGSVILPEDPNTSYHIAYDMKKRKIVAIRNSGSAIGGRDYVYEVYLAADGSRAFRVHMREQADALMHRFGVVPGSTR